MNEIKSVCSIDMIYDKQNLIGITIDISDNLLETLAVLDLLISNKMKSVMLVDNENHISIIIRQGIVDRNFQNGAEIILPNKEWEIIQSMLLDVFIHKGFSGYHYDIDLNSSFGELQLSIIFQK